MEFSQLDAVCLSGGFVSCVVLFWIAEAAYSVFTVFLK